MSWFSDYSIFLSFIHLFCATRHLLHFFRRQLSEILINSFNFPSLIALSSSFVFDIVVSPFYRDASRSFRFQREISPSIILYHIPNHGSLSIPADYQQLFREKCGNPSRQEQGFSCRSINIGTFFQNSETLYLCAKPYIYKAKRSPQGLRFNLYKWQTRVISY